MIGSLPLRISHGLRLTPWRWLGWGFYSQIDAFSKSSVASVNPDFWHQRINYSMTKCHQRQVIVLCHD